MYGVIVSANQDDFIGMFFVLQLYLKTNLDTVYPATGSAHRIAKRSEGLHDDISRRFEMDLKGTVVFLLKLEAKRSRAIRYGAPQFTIR